MAAPARSALAASWLSATFIGASVRRVDVPEPDLVVLTVHHDRQDHVLVLSGGDGAAGIGLVEKRPIGAPAGAFAGLLRKHLEGARVALVEARGERALGIVLRRGDASVEIVLEIARRGSILLLLDAASRVLGAAPNLVARAREIEAGQHYSPRSHAGTFAVEWPLSESELALSGRSLLAARRMRSDQSLESALERGLGRQRARLERRVSAIEADLSKSAAAEQLRADASAILAALASIPVRATHVDVEDPGTGAARRITLDPALAASAQANQLFVRARKLDRGRLIAGSRQAEARAAIASIDEALAALVAGDLGPAHRIASPAAKGRASPAVAKEKAGPSREPFRRYRSGDGTEILVGRSARDNDRVTFTHGRPHDLWLHARGRTGSHVILRVDPSARPSEATVEDAALLAAHFSAARGDIAADVLCIERRLLRKPRRGAPGSVLAEGATTVRVRIDPERIEQLLASAE